MAVVTLAAASQAAALVERLQGAEFGGRRLFMRPSTFEPDEVSRAHPEAAAAAWADLEAAQAAAERRQSSRQVRPDARGGSDEPKARHRKRSCSRSRSRGRRQGSSEAEGGGRRATWRSRSGSPRPFFDSARRGNIARTASCSRSPDLPGSSSRGGSQGLPHIRIRIHGGSPGRSVSLGTPPRSVQLGSSGLEGGSQTPPRSPDPTASTGAS